MSKLRNIHAASMALAAIVMAFYVTPYSATAQTTIGQQISDPSYFFTPESGLIRLRITTFSSTLAAYRLPLSMVTSRAWCLPDWTSQELHRLPSQ